MNKAKLKAYAPQARKDFIQMIRQRADLFGLTRKEIAAPQTSGEVAVIEGRPYPKRYAELHKRLAEKIRTEGLEPFVERIAYSWFNRFAALRFMEVNDFLSHGFRVLSNREAGKNEPEILTHAAEIDLPGLDKAKVIDLKLAGNKDAELYKMLLIAQCNELNRAMPFLFERINDETEILLPDNLLASDSVIRKMAAAIDEADWAEVEVIGWLYQFYISEKKDEVIGKTVKSEDIPAATQLFTPNWIVKYMTQNSLGRLWLEANPHSQLAQNMEFYISKGGREEGVGVSEEGGKGNDSSEFQGFDRLAESNGFGSDGLSTDEGFSEGGTLRSDESDSTRGGFGSVEHRGGTLTDINGGVPQLSLDSQRIAGGSSDSTDDRSTSELYDESTNESGFVVGGGSSQNAQLTNQKTNPQSLNPKPSLLNPEEIRVLDPACGSGHILVEAYELLKLIYTERGYGSRDIPLLILEKNLFGLDIDERAAQMASFALLMKARRDDRRIFEKIREKGLGERGKGSEKSSLTPNPFSLIPNILTVPDSSHLKAVEIAEMFFSNEEQTSGAGVPIRDGNFLFGEMQTQPSLMSGGSDSSLIPNPSPLNEVNETNVVDLLELFAQGKTLGSLIRVPHGFAAVVERLEQAIDAKRTGRNFLEQIAARQLEPFVRAAQMLASRYDCVIANPPYMGGKGMNGELKTFAAKNFPDSKSDLFAMFIERNIELTKKDGFLGFMTPFVWMFLSSYEKLRSRLLSEETIVSLVRPEYHAFFESAFVPICSFVIYNGQSSSKGDFFDLSKFYGADLQPIKLLEAVANPNCGWRYQASTTDFEKIPGSPIAYWVSDKVREVFFRSSAINNSTKIREGIHTGDNNTFLRLWFEISHPKFSSFETNYKSIDSNRKKWIPLNKGGAFRKWYGNNETVICFDSESRSRMSKLKGHVRPSQSLYFKPSVTWSKISSSLFGVRDCDAGFIFSDAGMCAFPEDESKKVITGFLCSTLTFELLQIINPTMNFQSGNVAALPILEKEVEQIKPQVDEIVEEAVAIARADWDSFETSWDFTSLPLLQGEREKGLGVSEEGKEVVSNSLSLIPNPFSTSVEECWNRWRDLTEQRIARMQHLETENNRLFIAAYGLEDELAPEVPLAQITLMRADAEKDVRRLLSYFVACLMGRYSLDQTGLIYADAGGKSFNPSRYQTFAADDDGIVPVTDLEWFPQEAARQFEKFIAVAFKGKGEDQGLGDRGKGLGEEGNAESSSSLTPKPSSLAPNLRWIAEQLGAKANETPVETVRRYFSTAFFKDHLQTYKKRPIYWLFSSGKQKAFEALVYLHRYNEATLPRMRHEYVLPLMSKLTAQIETLDNLKDSAATTSERTKLEKQVEVFRKKQIELAQFDEKLRHYSDMRISLDLDDGVKVNYGKFGDLLAEVKQVATTKE